MKAIVYTNYGAPEVLQLKNVVKPVPKDNEVLVRIKATAANSGDWRLRKADPYAVRFFFGFTKPKKNILGGVLSGEVEAVGKNVTRFKPGDQVFGMTGMSFGAYAEYKCLPETATLALKPDNISHKEAAVIPFGGTTAMHFLKKANIQPGQKVLVYGASGAVGTAVVQIAKHLGAVVTAVCSRTNAALVKSLGADKVIDYNTTDFTNSNEVYDVIFDTVNKTSFSNNLKVLSKKGVLLLSAAEMPQMMRGAWTNMTGGRKVVTGVNGEKTEDMVFLAGLIEAGKMKAVIDRSYPLEDMVAAHTYIEQGHKKGNVAIEV